ncbi:putative NUDIX hydrolase, conserved [Trypanosoma grayi]|uniref:putative NUDIX hydrolase, conserved n=1 Tax=Trypanosoma grayi TaxID=71804 RepID=UPI0004F4751E|nr:putative NUDIX hydrolase, conserved [Trypanosoma grayi]KEG05593.1 putative NUDIX hydrolase, conserved [Trypanosoma grayi]
MYRRNVCVVIFNEEVRFLGCQRIHEERYQFVQGGIEDWEDDTLQAAYREVEEEIGLLQEDLHFVGEILPPSGDPREFRYTLHQSSNLRRFGYVGQEQRLMLFFTTSNSIKKVRLIPPKETRALQEFSCVKWMTIENIIERCPREKRHIFVAVAKLAPPLAKAFLQKRSAL